MPVLAYWYEGGRPNGCCGFMPDGRDVVEAEGPWGACEAVGCDDAGGGIPVEEAAEEATPLVGAAAGVVVVVEVELGGARLLELGLEEEFWEVVLWLLALRVEPPTSLRKRWFIEDMETPPAHSARLHLKRRKRRPHADRVGKRWQKGKQHRQTRQVQSPVECTIDRQERGRWRFGEAASGLGV